MSIFVAILWVLILLAVLGLAGLAAVFWIRSHLELTHAHERGSGATPPPLPRRTILLWFLAYQGAVVAGLILLVTSQVFAPIVKAVDSAKNAALPALNYEQYRRRAVVHTPDNAGRPKPFRVAAGQDVLFVTGKEEFLGLDPIGIILQWKLLNGASPDSTKFIDWETFPFILCDHHGLREIIYRDIVKDTELTEEQKHGKYISPQDLRKSKGFFQLLVAHQKKREEDPQKFNLYLTPEERKAEEVRRRLHRFDSISQNNPATYGYLESRMPGRDPYLLVKLDKKEHADWFSMADVEKLPALPPKPQLVLTDQVLAACGLVVQPVPAMSLALPTALLTPQPALADIQEQADFTWKTMLRKRHPNDTFAEMQPFPAEEVSRVKAAYEKLQQAYLAQDAQAFDQSSQEFFATLREVSEKAGPYPGTDPSRILPGIKDMPVEDTIAIEMRFNRVRPFRWAWVLMVCSAALFVLSGLLYKLDRASFAEVVTAETETPTGSLATLGKLNYYLATLVYVGSLGFQVYGFACRVIIAGRPPVTTMYETVIWVSFMCGIFALILELIYRRHVIALAGSLAATMGLILADQLPLNLDSSLDPLVAVLQSNYWLIVHVLTIVSSYAGGTLAWALGNVALALIAFGTPKREMTKTLSTYTYRAIQIAVLLLAAGTFLGGWWAAEAWGRFWGWDPKEVWALIALVAYVIPLHMRYVGWVKDFGLAVSAVLCYSAVVMAWYGVNFVLGAGLHSYGFGGGGPWWVFWAGLLNIEWVILASIRYVRTQMPAA